MNEIATQQIFDKYAFILHEAGQTKIISTRSFGEIVRELGNATEWQYMGEDISYTTFLGDTIKRALIREGLGEWTINGNTFQIIKS